jgi:hypothetical protein
MNKTTNLLTAMRTAEDAHGALVAVKFAAAGKSVGMWAPEVDNDADVVASWERMQAAQKAYAKACG